MANPVEIVRDGETVGQSAPLPVADGTLEPLGYQQITDLSSAVGLTVPSGATLALIQPETKSVRWRDDGSNPTAAVGLVIEAGATLVYNGSLSALKVIETAASGKLNVSYYR